MRWGWKAYSGWILQSLVKQSKEGSHHILSRNVTQTDLLFVVRSSLWLQVMQRGKDGKEVRDLLW